MEINCYQCEDLIYKPIALLCSKILEDSGKILILLDVKDSEKAKIDNKEIDDGLWTFSKTKFLPHASVFDNDFLPSRQPIFITNTEENLNDANYLIITGAVSTNFIKQFDKICYFYRPDINNKHLSTLSQLTNLANKFNHFEQKDGKWQKLQ